MLTIKLTNYRCVWNFVHEHGEVTIPQVSKATGLSLPTVTKAVDFSLAEGIMHPLGLLGGERGRRAQTYCLSPDYAHFVFVFASNGRLFFEVHNFVSNVLQSGTVLFESDGFLSTLDGLLNKLLLDDRAIKMAGIAFPGSIRGGVIETSPLCSELVGLNLRAHVEEAFSLACFVENAVNVAVSSRLLGKEEEREKISVAFLFSSHGCRAGILQNGELFKGANCFAGRLENVLSFRGVYTEEHHAKLLRTVCALFDPSEVILYSDSSEDTKKLKQLAFKDFEGQAIPKIVEGRGLNRDVFLGLMVISKKVLLNPEHPGSVLGLDIK